MSSFTVDNFLQLTVNGVIDGTEYGLLGLAFGLILGVTGRFHFAFAFTFTISAYLASVATQSWGIPYWPSMVIGALVGAAFGVAMEFLIYRPLAARAGAYALLTIFVASLGLSIIGKNAISLYWISSGSQQIGGFDNRGINFASEHISILDIDMLIASWILIVLTALVLRFTKLGRMVRAVRSNPEMSLAVGVNPKTIFLLVFAVGSFLGGISAVFVATKTAATPDMGFNPLFYAFTIAFLSGLTTRPLVIGLVGLVIGLIQSWSNLVLPLQWVQLVVFAILFFYVALRPVQFRALLHQLVPTVPSRATAR
ncbi:MAG: branched-chain amino acid ABC transporter permease [Mycobacteriales bacterium]